jgi:hypothetical protein
MAISRSHDANCLTVSWIKTDRPTRLMSHGAFADICGLDLDRSYYIGGIEHGERNVSLVNIERIAKR